MLLVSNFIEIGIVTFISILVSIYFYLNRNFQYWKNKNVPYLKPVPFFGNMSGLVRLREPSGLVFRSLYNQTTEPFIGIYIFYEPSLLIRDPELIKTILITDFQYFNDHMVLANKENDPISVHILFFLKNPEWKELRTKISPVFTSSKIKTMFELMNNSGKELVDYLNQMINENPIIEIKDVLQKYTVDVITSSAFGIEANCFKDENSQFTAVARKIFNWSDLLVSLRIACHFFTPRLVKLFKMKLFYPDCIAFLKNCFDQVMDERKKSKKIRNDLIDILIQIQSQDNTFIEGDKLVSQAIMFFVAGFETSSSTITFALYEIAHNQQIQEKLRQEIRQISEEEGINYESIKKMTYLEMCIKETLRKYPVFPFVDRRCNTNYKIPGTEIIIEKGTSCIISTMGLHHDPKYYPNPEIFDPERFSKINNNQSPFLAFGLGPRGCIGERFGMLQTKLGLAYIIKSFIVETCDQTQKEIKLEPKGLVLWPVDGIKLKFVSAL